MSSDMQKAMFQALDEWFATVQGARVADAFFAESQFLRECLYGETLLQLGSCADNAVFHKLRFQYKYLLSPCLSKDTNLVSSLTQMPLANNSVDCVLAPLTLHAFSHEKNPIDEIDRILKPMGRVVFWGINSFSLWGLWLQMSRSACFGRAGGVSHSIFSIKRAMLHRGYIQTHLSGFYYIPPVKSATMISKLQILNVAGKMISPSPSGFYCFVVQKLQENGVVQPLFKTTDQYRWSVLQPARTGWQTRS